MAAAGERTWTRARAALAAAAALAIAGRLAAAAFTDLYGDEAYYWVWSHHLSGAYYDNTPLVAWLLAGSRALLGDGALAVRALALACGGAAIACAFGLAREFWGRDDPGAPWLAAALVATMPVASLAGAFLGPDSPLFALWLLTVWMLWRAFDEPGRIPRWLAAGACAGLALLAKYSAGLLVVGALAFALLDRRGAADAAGPRARHVLLRPGPYLGALAALAVFSPVLLWNLEHGWAGLAFQAARYGGDRGTLALRLGDFLGGQWLAAGPLVFPLAFAVAARRVRDGDRRHLFLVCSALPVLLFFAASAFRTWIYANWPAFVWPAAAVALADPALSARTVVLFSGKALARTAALAGAAVCLAGALYAVHPLRADEIARRLQGWSELGDALRPLDPGGALYADNFQLASHLAFHLRAEDRARVARFPETRLTAWDFWDLPPAPRGPALFVTDAAEAPPPALAHCRAERLADLPFEWRGQPLRLVRVWRLECAH